MATSRRFELDATDWGKIGRGALIAGGGAAVLYLLEALPNVNVGEAWTPIFVAVASVGLNTIRKLFLGR